MSDPDKDALVAMIDRAIMEVGESPVSQCG